MAKKKNNHQAKKEPTKDYGFLPDLPKSIKGYLISLALILIAAIVLFSFFGLAGKGGLQIFNSLLFLFGKATYLLPLFFVLAGVIFFIGSHQPNRILKMTGFAFSLCLLGLSAILNSFGTIEKLSVRSRPLGGFVGYFLSFPILRFFGFWVNLIIFMLMIIFGFLVFWQIAKKIQPRTAQELSEKIPILKKILEPKLKIREIPGVREDPNRQAREASLPNLKTKPIPGLMTGSGLSLYKNPPLDLLELEKGEPIAGDIRNNMVIIKNTLENFDIPVEMGEVNTGPTVTQYTLKPAEGIKLSKITTLNNDLSLALATHPIRIEAPIPGKSLVGIEVPNSSRTMVRLRNLFEDEAFKNSASPLLFSLGRDVAGIPAFADLSRMPHLLVAGATGTGKTICLNSILLGLLYRNSPETMRLIMVDPKRVEFPVYQDIPHLLSPIIYDSQKTVNALKWLTKEMERRFEVLAAAKTRDIASYNKIISQKMSKTKSGRDSEGISEEILEIMPYIVVIIDELADLMAARGKEVEAGIVRLAQMARAVGIHLIVATQRPSVEVITGLIKANITSRITFQVASQIDSRTVIDAAGAEKLLGAGDMLFISPEISKPRRIQGAYVTEKEVKRVTDFLKSQKEDFGLLTENFLAEELARELKGGEDVGQELFNSDNEDSLYLEAKQLVIEYKKASASMLQRRLRVGYARAARLLDILEERGVVGPADGARPREVYVKTEPTLENSVPMPREKNEDDDDWEKV
ncbi:DNA translocase FtsK 4TM domain-containing protein [Patescibacteria group bacterium]|nr:DNA translocase FtsK 4TM domain-containing protein [Patescibacteria group bacterium]